jgi:hypothetical protein
MNGEFRILHTALAAACVIIRWSGRFPPLQDLCNPDD